MKHTSPTPQPEASKPAQNPPGSFLWSKLGLFIVLAASYALFRWQEAFIAAGPVIYLPVLFFEAIAGAFMARHLVYRQTMDEFAWRGFFTEEWKKLSGAEQVRWTIGSTLFLIYCASLIAAALAK